MAVIQNDLRLLNNRAFSAFWNLTEKLDGTGFRVFETYRSPERQDALFKKGTTKAIRYQSAHQYGLAVDYVMFRDGKWTWEIEPYEWEILHTHARECGLELGPNWDPGHIEHPLWRILSVAMKQ